MTSAHHTGKPRIDTNRNPKGKKEDHMTEGSKPDFDVFSIRERERRKDVFTKIGVAFSRQDRQGVTILRPHFAPNSVSLLFTE